jgi:bis(5'-nucleosyl)-tetraphosphatase (symmetrical)
LLDALPWDTASDRLWLAGDLVGHGPDPAGVLRVARGLAAELEDRFLCVIGNHDLRLVGVHAGAVRNAKASGLASSLLEARDGEALLAWLAGLPFLHHEPPLDGGSGSILEAPLVLVHAGLDPRWTVDEARRRAREAEDLLRDPVRRDDLLAAIFSRDPTESGQADLDRATETARVMTTIRTLDRNGGLCDHTGPPETAPAGCRPWFQVTDRASRDATVVFGHWASLGLRLAEGWIALDSGCAWGGPLSAVRLDDRRVFQVPRSD